MGYAAHRSKKKIRCFGELELYSVLVYQNFVSPKSACVDEQRGKTIRGQP